MLLVYALKMIDHCRRLARQATARACLLTRYSVGSRMPINRAIMAITTSSSMSVKAWRLMMYMLSGDSVQSQNKPTACLRDVAFAVPEPYLSPRENTSILPAQWDQSQ